MNSDPELEFDDLGIFIGGLDDGKFFITVTTSDGEFYTHLNEFELLELIRKFYNY